MSWFQGKVIQTKIFVELQKNNFFKFNNLKKNAKLKKLKTERKNS